MTSCLYVASLSYGYLYEDRPGFHWAGWSHWATETRATPPRSLSRAVSGWLGHRTAYDPWWQHGASLVLHLVNGVLLWTLARRLGFSRVAVMVAAGLFVLHPLQIEAVAYVANRSEILMTLCVLAALLCAEAGWWLLAALVAAAAVGAKEAGMVAVVLVPLWAWWRRVPTWTIEARVYWGVACWIGLLVGIDRFRQVSLLWMTGDSLTTTLTAWTMLLGQWMIPMHQSADPDWAGLVLWPVASAAFALWGLALGILWQEWRTPRSWPVVLISWTAILILPRLLWQLGEGLHEHHVYAAAPILSLSVGRLFSTEDV